MCSNVYPTPFDGILTSSPQPGATIPENPFVHFSRALEFLWQQQLWDWQQQVSSKMSQTGVLLSNIWSHTKRFNLFNLIPEKDYCCCVFKTPYLDVNDSTLQNIRCHIWVDNSVLWSYLKCRIFKMTVFPFVQVLQNIPTKAEVG